MAVTLITSTAACFGTITPSQIDLNLAGAELLVVAVGWSSANNGFNPPRVSVNGEIMALVPSPVEQDELTGVVAIYTLSLVNPPNSTLPIVFTQTTFDGNMQVAIHAYSGTSQSLGVIFTDEYGTNDSGVDTGTTNITGVSAGSLTTFAGFTFFGGTPAAIGFSTGWTATHAATATSEGVYAATNDTSGDFSVTVTPTPDSFFNMLCIGWEVLEGTPATGFTGVDLVTSSVTCLGVLSAAVEGTVTFDPTNAADFLVAAVGWATSDPLTPPAVIYGSTIMPLVLSPIKVDGNFGALAVYALPLSSVDYTGAVTVTINAAPNFIGLTAISLAAYSGSSQQLGVLVTDEYGTNTVPVLTGTTAINGISPGSSLAFVVCSFFGHVPTEVSRSAGWDDMGNANNGVNQSMFSFHNKYRSGGNFDITLVAAPDEFNFFCFAYEVVVVGTPRPASQVSITNTQISYLGAIGLNEVDVTFDAMGASALVLCAARTNEVAAPATYTFAGQPFYFISSCQILDLDFGAAVDIAILANPPSGVQTVTAVGPSGYIGDTTITLVGLTNLSGVVGVRVTESSQGDSQTVAMGPSDPTSLMLAFVASPFTFNDQTPNYGWERIIANTSGAHIASWLFSTVGSSDLSLYLTSPAFSKTQTIILEMVHSLPTTLYTNMIESSVRSYPVQQSSGQIAASFSTPSGPGFQLLNVELLMKSTGGNAFFTVSLFDETTSDTTVLTTVADSTLSSTPSTVNVTCNINLTALSRYQIVLTTTNNSTASWCVSGNVTGLGVIEEFFVVGTWSVPNFFNSPEDYHDADNPNAGDGAFIMGITGQVIAVRGGGGTAMPSPTASGGGSFIAKLTPNGQTFHLYHETWLDQPMKAVDQLQPDDFYLARLPSFVAAVNLSFSIPQCSYSGMNDNVKETTGLNWPGSVQLLADTIALLRTRNPEVKVYMSVQQNTPEQAYNEPYTETWPCWGGMTDQHVDNMRQFCIDTGMDGMVIDYECLSQTQDPQHHCTYTPEGIPTCFTDTELVSVVKQIRKGFPRPWTVILDVQHVGAYVGINYFYGQPFGYNNGYDYCVSIDAEAVAAIDGMEIESYDAGDLYDPRTAARCFQDMFPGMPIWIGCRVGPIQYQDVKITPFQFRDFCNTAIMQGLAGCHMYSSMWDVVPSPGSNNPLAGGAPFGNYGPEFPDGNICAAIVAEVFNLTDSNKRLDNNRLSQGLKGPPFF